MDRRRSRGDAAILLTFFALAAIAVSALVIAGAAVTARQSARDAERATHAFLAADTGIERGYAAYVWSVGGANLECADVLGEAVGAHAEYDVFVRGDPFDDTPTNCPALADVNSDPPTRALCVTAVGRTTDGRIQRRLENDTDRTLCRP